MIKIHNVQQGTEEWLQLRRGIITSTVVKSLITPTFKISNNDKTRKVFYKLAGERITKILEENYLSYDMERGNFEEPIARDLYNEGKKDKAGECGFITNTIKGVTVGYSPDGVVGQDGLIEIKSAKQSIQVERIVTNETPKEHLPQIYFGILVSGRKWCDFISYSNGMKMLEIRENKDEAKEKVLIEACILAEEKIQEIVNTYFENSKNYKQADRVEFITNEINL